MIDFSTKYMGLNLRNPLVPSASPLTHSVDNVKKLEEAGAGAIVMDSLFEEEINLEAAELNHYLEYSTESFAESLSYYPTHEDYYVGPELYLERIKKLKSAVDIPVIASLNGKDTGTWTNYAKLIEEAGADAIELNIYLFETSFDITGTEVEKRYIDIVKSVKSNIKIPVAVKLGPFFSAFASHAKRLVDEGKADALVIFNRYYQPDFDIENLNVIPNLVLSDPLEMRLPLQWIALLYERVDASLAFTRGVHSHEDVVKAIMAGADVVQMASVLLKEGIGKLKDIFNDLKLWMEENEYESTDFMRGSLSHKFCPDPSALERANYMKILKSYSA